jgi:predicted Zn-dependent peptidase
MKNTTLSNGMPVLLIPIEGTKAVTVLTLTKLGSRFEPDHLWGASHFIEHLMFKGTEKRPHYSIIAKELDRYGAEYNAYTGKERTGYYVRIDSDKADVAIDLLSDVLFNSLFEEKEMEREKKVIVEEIKMYDENPIMNLGNLLEQGVYRGHILGKDIAGTAESVLSMKRDDVIGFRDAHYTPQNMRLVVAGDVSNDMLAKLEDTFGRVPAGTGPADCEAFGGYQPHKEPHVEIQYKDLKQVQLGIAFPGPGKHDDQKYATALLAYILGGSMGSRLFSEIREERGLCYTIRAMSDQYTDIGDFAITAGLDAERMEEAIPAIFEEITKLKQEGVTAEELRHAKDHLEGALKLRLENSSNVAEFYGGQALFFDEILSPAEVLQKYTAVTEEDLKQAANDILKGDRITVAAIGPYEKEDDLRKLIPVLQ